MPKPFESLLNLIKRESYARLVVQEKPLTFAGEFPQRVFDEFFPFRRIIIARYAVTVIDFRRVNFDFIANHAAFKFAFKLFQKFPVDSLGLAPEIFRDEIV